MITTNYNDIFHWLIMPLSGSATHDISVWVSWHARLMVLSWGFLLPLGVIIARFFKVLPDQNWPQVLDNKFWWKTHLYGQVCGLLFALVGLGLILGHSKAATDLARWHAILGWSVMILGMTQALAGFARGSKGGPTDSTMRGDHYDMTAWRKSFEWLHKSLGYLGL